MGKKTPIDDLQVITLIAGLGVLKEVQKQVSANVDGCFSADQPTAEQIRTYAYALIHEICELTDEFPGWKPWKEAKKIRKDRLADEFADVLAFLGVLLNYLESLGLTMRDLGVAYHSKTLVNQARLNGEVEGYQVQKERENGG